MHLADYAPPLQPIASEDTLLSFPSQDFSHIRLTEPERRDSRSKLPLMTTCGFTQFRALDNKLSSQINSRKLQRGLALETIMRVNALPGYSEHHTGEALDLGTSAEMSLETQFEETRAFEWLAKTHTNFNFLSYPRNHAHGFTSLGTGAMPDQQKPSPLLGIWSCLTCHLCLK